MNEHSVDLDHGLGGGSAAANVEVQKQQNDGHHQVDRPQNDCSQTQDFLLVVDVPRMNPT